MRRLEQWVGKPCCALLTLARKAAPRRRYERPRKILLLKLIEQGASVLAFSAIEECVRRVGPTNVYFWVFAENKDIVRILGLIPDENLIVLSHKTPLQFLSTLFQNLRKIRRAGIDTVIDMEFFSRASAILAFLSGARVRVGLHRYTSEAPYRGDLFTHRIAYNPFLHTSKAYLQLVRTAFESADTVPAGKMAVADLVVKTPSFVPTAAETANVRALIQREVGGQALQIRSWIFLLNPNASDLLPIRKWPTENFLVLAKRLLGEFENGYVLLTGAPSEAEIVESIARQIDDRRCKSVAGKTTLRELFTLYGLADILVTNDSGPGHFASMTPIDSIVLFGPETPLLFGPMGARSRLVWKELACGPCVSPLNHRLSPCSDAICMKAITVDEIWNRIQNCLVERERKELILPRQAPSSPRTELEPQLFQ